MRSYNPYEAPPSSSSSSSPSSSSSSQHHYESLPHRKLKWFYLAAILGPFVLAMITTLAKATALFFFPLNLVLMIAAVVSPMMWIHATWSFMPNEDQNDVTPGSAVIRCFIPIRNIFWMFELYGRIANSLRRRLAKHKTARMTAPTTLAWVTPTAPLVAVFSFMIALASRSPPDPNGAAPPASMTTMFMTLVWFATPFILFAFMKRIDDCNEELLSLRAAKRARKVRAEKPVVARRGKQLAPSNEAS